METFRYLGKEIQDRNLISGFIGRKSAIFRSDRSQACACIQHFEKRAPTFAEHVEVWP